MCDLAGVEGVGTPLRVRGYGCFSPFFLQPKTSGHYSNFLSPYRWHHEGKLRMTRYFSQRGAYFDDQMGTIYQPESVTVTDVGEIKTGLLDAAGRPIFRSDHIPMGFALRPGVRIKAGSRQC